MVFLRIFYHKHTSIENFYTFVPVIRKRIPLISKQFNLLIMETLKKSRKQAQQQAQPKAQQQAQPKAQPETMPESMDEKRAKFEALFLGKPERIARPITERQLFNNDLNNQVRGLGTWFSAIRLPENRDRLLSFLADQKSKGKIFDKSKIETLLNVESKEAKNEGFKLFQKYVNEKEQSKTTFTANQATGIFLRACLAE